MSNASRFNEPTPLAPPGFDAFPQVWARRGSSSLKGWIAGRKDRRAAKLAEISTILDDMKSPFARTANGKVGLLGYVMARG
jgi:hypothetical protein